MVLPEPAGQLDGRSARRIGIAVVNGQTVRPQFRHVGERVAPHHTGRQSGCARFDFLSELNALTDRARLRDHLVAADQRGDLHVGSDRSNFAGHDSQEERGGTGSGFEEIHVRIGVIADDGVAVLQHPLGQNAVQIERRHDGDFLTQNLPGFLKQISFRVQFVCSFHRSVQSEVSAVDRAGFGDSLQELAGKSVKGIRLQRAARRIGTSPEGRHEFHVRMLVEHGQRSADFIPHTTVIRKEFVAAVDVEIVQTAWHGIERRDLLTAFSDEDAGHAAGS